MTEQKINKSDFVDNNDTVWESVGENIRKGSKSYESLKSTLDNLDESVKMNLPIIPLKGHWEHVVDTVNDDLSHSFSKHFSSGGAGYVRLNANVYAIVSLSSSSNGSQYIACLPANFKKNDCFIVFFQPATSVFTSEYLIYVGDN